MLASYLFLVVTLYQQNKGIMNNEKKQIVGWAVCYVPTKNGRIFCGLKSESIASFKNQLDALQYCDAANMGEYIDDLHIGYRVYPMHWIPKGVNLR